MINQSGARMFVSCCNNAVLIKSANYRNTNKHLCTKYKCIQIFQNLYIYFWEYINSEKKNDEKKIVQSIIDRAKTEHYYSASVLFCVV